jgi:excisionase family DNA binding protein
MSVYEVSTILKVHSNTVYDLISKGKIRVIRVGRSIRIAEKALNRFLKIKIRRNSFCI